MEEVTAIIQEMFKDRVERKEEVADIEFRQIKYDLIHDVIEGEPTPSLSYFALSRLAVSVWQKNIIDTLKQTPNVDFIYIFEDFQKCKDFFQQIENKILNGTQKGVISCVPFAEKYLPQMFYEIFEELISKIKNNITQFSKSLGKLNVPLPIEIIEIYVRNIQLTLQGTINLQNTALYLVENSNLSSINKYAISCYYCLTEKICDLLEEMPDNFIIDFHSKKEFRLMVYWTYYLQNKHDELKDIAMWWYSSPLFVGVNDYLIKKSIKEGNEVAVQFIWQNFKTVNEGQWLSSLYNYSKSVNLWFFITSQLKSCESVQSLCERFGYRLLSMLASDSRWSSYFLASFQCVLRYLYGMDPHSAVKTAIVSYLYDKSTVDFYLQRFLYQYKIPFRFSSETILSIILAIDSDIVLINLLLNFKRKPNMKSLFGNEKYIFKLINGLFEAEKLDLFKVFIYEIFTESKAEMFLNCFVNTISVKFCSKFLKCKHFEKMADTFFILSCGESGLESFKSELPFKEDGKIIGDILKSKSFEKVPLITKFLIWCFNGNKEKILDCKIKLFNLENHSNRYCNTLLVHQLQSLIKLKRFQAVKLHLKWAGIHEKVFKNICGNSLNEK